MQAQRRLFALPLLLAAAAWTSSARAEEPGDSDEEYRTVVTALGFEDKEFDSPRSIDVIDEDDMKRLKGRSTPELLSETTGMFVQKTAHGHGAPIMRGLIGIHNLILFNEIRLNNSTWRTGPIQYLNLIDPFSIEKIEVLRGPGSLLYGSDAVGGVVSVFGRSPILSDHPTLSPALSGKFSTADLGYAGHYGLGLGCPTFGTVFGGSYKSFGDLRAGPDVGLQKFTGYREADFDFNARVKLFSGGQLEIGTYLVSLFDAGRIDQLASNNRLRYNDNSRDLVYLRFLGEEKDLDLDTKLTLSYQHQTEVNKDIRYASLYDVINRITYDNVYVDTVGFSGSVSKKFLDQRLEFAGGVDVYADFVDADSMRLDGGVTPAPKTSLYPSDSRYATYEVFALLRWNLQRHARGLHVWGGGRFSYTTAFSPDVLDYGDISYAHPSGTGSAGVNYTLKEILNTGITFSEGLRSPKLSETVIFGDMGTAFEIPNPDLGPERAETLEAFAKFSHRLFDVNVAFFTTWFFDLLAKTAATYEGQTEIDGKPVQRTENLDRALLLGPEASLAFHFGKLFGADGLKLKGNLAYLWARQESCSEGDCETHPMQRIPPLFFTAVLGYYDDDRDDFDYSAEIIVRGAMQQDRLSPEDISDVRIPEGGTPGWTTLSLRGMFEYKRRLLVTIILENLLNETYKVHGSGIYEPGLNGSINLAVRY